MFVSKSVSLEIADLLMEKVEIGEFKSVSEFVQKAVKNELKED